MKAHVVKMKTNAEHAENFTALAVATRNVAMRPYNTHGAKQRCAVPLVGGVADALVAINKLCSITARSKILRC